MWFEDVYLRTDYNYISSRVRLIRNFDTHLFPEKLETVEAKALVNDVLSSFEDINKVENTHFSLARLDALNDIDRLTMMERKIINKGIIDRRNPMGMAINDYEDVGILINGDDHIRVQLNKGGLVIDGLLERANKYDDYINEKYSYAFDDKYGYLTAYPTNLGTGLKVSVVMHLPLLSKMKNFANLKSDIGRFAVELKGMYGEGRENYGDLYIVSNSRTLGRNENEILYLVKRVAMQLNTQEEKLRRISLRDKSLCMKDEAYKSYGILRYARKISLKDSMMYLGSLMQARADELIAFEREESIYGLMIGVQPGNILKLSDRPLSKEETDEARASYIRKLLPELSEQ